VIRKLHIYLGLLTAPYLVVFGLSSLSMNHPGGVFDSEPRVRNWTVQIPSPVRPPANRVAAARHVQRAIPLDGYLPEYTLTTNENGALLIQLYVPGRRYDIQYDRKQGTAKVTETHRGIWGVLRSLHGRVGVPELRAWSISWRLYTEITLAALLFAIISGGMVWWPRVRQHRNGILITTAGSGFCLGLMLWIWI
jgi:hypothetical protein